MAVKNNIRSMRFSDATIELIELQCGDSFTAKFESLVSKCCFELPRKEQQLAALEQQISEERARLAALKRDANKLQQTIFSLDRAVSNATFVVGQGIKVLEAMVQSSNTSSGV